MQRENLIDEMMLLALPLRLILFGIAVWAVIPISWIDSKRMSLVVPTTPGVFAVDILLLIAGIGIMVGKRWGVYLFLFVGAGWLGFSLGTAFVDQAFAWALGLAFALVYVFVVAFLIKLEFGKSFMDSGMRWFEGLPQAIGAMRCCVTVAGKHHWYRVSKMDRNGAFLISENDWIKDCLKEKRWECRFQFHDRTFDGVCQPVIRVREKNAIGIRFVELSGDTKKRLGDFCEILQGYGYV